MTGAAPRPDPATVADVDGPAAPSNAPADDVTGARDPVGSASPPAVTALVGLLSTLDAAPTLTKSDLADLLFERIGLNKREAKDMVEAFFDALHQTLVEGEDMKIAGFGNFSIRRKAPRPGRNPRTGEPIPIAARNVVVFHASQKLKAVVQGPPPAAPDIG